MIQRERHDDDDDDGVANVRQSGFRELILLLFKNFLSSFHISHAFLHLQKPTEAPLALVTHLYQHAAHVPTPLGSCAGVDQTLHRGLRWLSEIIPSRRVVAALSC